MANFNTSELLDVLKKSGLPMGDSRQMRQAAPFAPEPVANQVFGQDRGIPEGKSRYMQKISRIAAMDQKLSGVYSDPTSKLYIEHAGQREKALIGAENVGYKEAGDIQGAVESRRKDLEEMIRGALDLYRQLIGVNERDEVENRRIEKAAKKTGRVTVTTKGKTTGKGAGTGGGGRTISSFFELTPDERRKIERAGISKKDIGAMSEFLFRTKADSQKYIIDERLDKKMKGTLDAKRIKQERDKYEGSKKKGTTKKRAPLF